MLLLPGELGLQVGRQGVYRAREFLVDLLEPLPLSLPLGEGRPEGGGRGILVVEDFVKGLADGRDDVLDLHICITGDTSAKEPIFLILVCMCIACDRYT